MMNLSCLIVLLSAVVGANAHPSSNHMVSRRTLTHHPKQPHHQLEEEEATDKVLVVVYVQHCFIAGGTLNVDTSDGTIKGNMRRLLEETAVRKFKLVVFTQDWHPADHCSFKEYPKDNCKGFWPPHCSYDVVPTAVFNQNTQIPTQRPYSTAKPPAAIWTTVPEWTDRIDRDTFPTPSEEYSQYGYYVERSSPNIASDFLGLPGVFKAQVDTKTIRPAVTGLGDRGALTVNLGTLHGVPAIAFRKGMEEDVDSNSAFKNEAGTDTGLKDVILEALSAGRERVSPGNVGVYSMGIAADVCVKDTAVHARELGFKSFYVQDAVYGVFESGRQVCKSLSGAGVKCTPTSKV